MSRINNTIKIEDDITTILITKDDDKFYLKELLIDSENLSLLDKVHVTNKNYAFTKKKNIAHIVMNHVSNAYTVIDHINGNRLDNRKENLRVLTIHENCANKSISKSNVNIVGISYREKGNYKYFRATCSDLITTTIEKGKYKNHGSATKRYSKQFNIGKLGEEEALKQAKKWLEYKRKEFGYPQ